MVTTLTDTGHTITTDVPVVQGGGDSAAQPVETLLAALVGCEQATAVYVGRMMRPRLAIDRIDFAITAVRDQRGALHRPITDVPPIPARLQAVRGTATVHRAGGGAITDEELHVLAEQVEARCPVANMMAASGCAIAIDWVDGNRGGGGTTLQE